MKIDGIEILQGHVLDALKEIEDGSVQCCVTSPPYFNLRAYDGDQEQVWGGSKDCSHKWNSDGYCKECLAWKGGLGNEPTMEQYVSNLVMVFREVRRVLRDDGVLWLNLADSYATQRNDHVGGGLGDNSVNEHSTIAKRGRFCPEGTKMKDLVGVPHALAFALRDDGWWWRSTTIWAKAISYCEEYSGSCMPESVSGWRWERCKVKVSGVWSKDNPHPSKLGGGQNESMARTGLSGGNPKATNAKYEPCPGCEKCEENDGYVLKKGSWRPTSSHEYLFMFAKSDRYFGNGEAVKEPSRDPEGTSKRYESEFGGSKNKKLLETDQVHTRCIGEREWDGGRNPRNVWTINPSRFPGSHFACFPEELPEKCIKASTSPKACGVCGAPYAPVVEKKRSHMSGSGKSGNLPTGKNGPNMQGGGETGDIRNGPCVSSKILSYRPTCEHKDDTGKCKVLDPFLGRGTTAFVARKMGHEAVGVELSPDYVKIAETWIEKRMREEKVMENENLSKVFS